VLIYRALTWEWSDLVPTSIRFWICSAVFVLVACGTSRTLDAPDAAAAFPPDAANSSSDGGAADAGPGIPWSIVNQPPVDTSAFYNDGGSLYTKQLLNAGHGGPYNHLMPGSDSVVAYMLALDANGNVPWNPYGGFITGDFATFGDRDQNGKGLYISKLSDPVYSVSGAARCGPVFEPKAHRTAGVIDNLVFHAPNGARGSGAVSGAASSDTALAIWDLSGDPADITSGFALHFYGYGNGIALPPCPGNGHAGTLADPCPFGAPGAGGYCGFNDPVNGRDYDNGAGSVSNAGSPYSAMNRFFELVAGHFHHASHAATACEGPSGGNEPVWVFPNSGSRLDIGSPQYWGDSGACKCGSACTQETDASMGPPNGSLYYLDYTDDQLACLNPNLPSTTCTGLDGVPVTKLDAAHFALIEQLTYYGWYQADTGGQATGGLAFLHHEGGTAYKYYHDQGMRNPDPFTDRCPFCMQTFIDYMAVHCSGSYTDPTAWCYHLSANSTDGDSWNTRIFYNLPNGLPGPDNGAQGCSAAEATAGRCGVGKHLHIADPCVAVGMAGLAADPTGTWTACSTN
jgi:hypothetical protein